MQLTAGADGDHWEATLGKFFDATTIHYALVATDAAGMKYWFNNGGDNFEATVAGETPNQVVPLTGPSWQVTYSTNSTSHFSAGWKAFDGTNSTSWHPETFAYPSGRSWLGYEFLEPTRIDRYTVRLCPDYISYDKNRSRDISLEGSNGGGWVTLDSRPYLSPSYSCQSWSFAVTAPGEYKKYRLVVTDTSGNNYYSIGELELEQAPELQIRHSPENGSLTSADDLMVSLDAAGSLFGYAMVEVVYSTDDVNWFVAVLQLTGETGYDHWEANLGQFAAGASVSYALVATDPGGNETWFNNGGADYTATVAP
jgi:hypothetical protein